MEKKIFIEKKNARDVGSCSFCNKMTRGTLHGKRPYRKVLEVSGDSMKVRMCKECAKDFAEFAQDVRW